MVAAIIKLIFNVNYGVAGNNAVSHGFFDTGFNGWDEFAGYRAAFDAVDEFKALTGFILAQTQPDMTVLATATALANELAFGFNTILTDCFTVSHLGCTNVSLNSKFTLHAINNDLQMQLTHTRDNGLAGFMINLDSKCRILFSQALQGNAHLFLVGFGLRLNGDTDRRLWEGNAFQYYRMGRITQGITGGGTFETNNSGDVTGINFANVFTFIGVHPYNAANALFVAG